MDFIHLRGIEFIQFLQTRFPDKSEFLMELSIIGDPRNTFQIYFPIALHLDRSAGIKLIWATAVAEWLNTIMKWFLHGERPYWWVQETNLYTSANRPQLNQYRLTCETGPGGPSGHAMLSSCMGHTSCLAIAAHAAAAASAAAKAAGDDAAEVSAYRSITVIFVWSTFAIYLFLVCISRCYIAAHFPHQVIVGSILGIMVSEVVQRIDTDALATSTYYFFAILQIMSGTAVYFLLVKLGDDPMWSLALARKRCANANWVSINTTLLFSLCRGCGILLGMGTGLWIMRYWENNSVNVDDTALHRWLMIFVCLLVTQGSEHFVPYPSRESPNVFYLFAIIRHFTQMLLIMAIIPVISLPILHRLF